MGGSACLHVILTYTFSVAETQTARGCFFIDGIILAYYQVVRARVAWTPLSATELTIPMPGAIAGATAQARRGYGVMRLADYH
jgi:hypothetical protein